jgi:hypothetical protein
MLYHRNGQARKETQEVVDGGAARETRSSTGKSQRGAQGEGGSQAEGEGAARSEGEAAA